MHYLALLYELFLTHTSDFKWGISIANIADFSKPPQEISYSHQTIVTVSGLIWSRWGTQIIPKNINVVAVNLTMAGTGIYQLSRKIREDFFNQEETITAKE
jgi:hypothetical protein